MVAEGVRRSFGDVQAVRGIDLTARPGEVTALVGPNGAGKTTLLLVLATLLVPDAGDGADRRARPADASRTRCARGWAGRRTSSGSTTTSPAASTSCSAAAAMRLPSAAAARPRGGAARAGPADRPRRPAGAHAVARAEAAARPDAGARARPVGAAARRAGVRAGPAVARRAARPAAGAGRPRARRCWSARTCSATSRSWPTGSCSSTQGVTVGEHRIDQLPAGDRAAAVAAAGARHVRAAGGRSKGYDHGEPTAAGVDVLLTGDEAAAELLGKLVRKKVPVVSCQPLGGQLEATYLELTAVTRVRGSPSVARQEFTLRIRAGRWRWLLLRLVRRPDAVHRADARLHRARHRGRGPPTRASSCTAD